MTAVRVDEGAKVRITKVADAAPAGIETDVGTDAAESLDDKPTRAPPLGAPDDSDAVPVTVPSPEIEPAESATADRVATAGVVGTVGAAGDGTPASGSLAFRHPDAPATSINAPAMQTRDQPRQQERTTLHAPRSRSGVPEFVSPPPAMSAPGH